MSTTEEPSARYQSAYWREEGGDKWVANIESVERQISGLSRILIDRAAPRPGETVLDVGCGGGVTSRDVAELVGSSGHVLGVDVSERILDVARRRYGDVGRLEFEAGDAESMALPAQRFDLIVSRFGVMFFDDPVAAFRNLLSALKPGGRLVCLCWRTAPENPWMMVPAAAVFAVLGPPSTPQDPTAPGPFAFGDPDRVRDILTQSGFADIALEPIDEPVDLGSVDRAVRQMSELGPAAPLLAEASGPDRARAIASLEAALAPYETMDGLRLPSATWIVTAIRPKDA